MKTAAALIVLMSTAVAAVAQEPQILRQEQREFQILVKEKPSGKSLVTIADRVDGSTAVTTDADVSVSWLFYTYHYSFHGVEVWNGTSLQQLVSSANDNGKKLSVRVKTDRDVAAIETGDQTAKTSTHITTSTGYWRLPPGEKLPREIDIVDADRGNLSHAKLELVGDEMLVIQQEKIPARHFRLRGGIEADIWFDQQDRLVRQTSVEEGEATELRLVRKSVMAPSTTQR